MFWVLDAQADRWTAARDLNVYPTYSQNGAFSSSLCKLQPIEKTRTLMREGVYRDDYGFLPVFG